MQRRLVVSFLCCCWAAWKPAQATNERAAALLKSRAALFLQTGDLRRGVRDADVQVPSERSTGDVATILRPLAGVEPDTVTFGILAKDLGSVDLMTNTYFADLVLTLQWRDPRAAELAAELGVDNFTLSQDEASQAIWMPDIKVTNRDIQCEDVISTAVTIDATGGVTKVQRVAHVLKTPYNATAFPFDQQDLTVQIASTAYMSDELQLLPTSISEVAGVGPDASLPDFTIAGSSARAFIEEDAALVKSRGELRVTVARRHQPVVISLIVPELLVIVIAVSVFWFPLAGPFAMPRVSTAIVAYLAFTMLQGRTTTYIPAKGGLVWMDLWEYACQCLLLFVLALNLFVLAVFHSYGMPKMAQGMNRELRSLTITVAVLALLFAFGGSGGEGLPFLTVFILVAITTVGVVYVTRSLKRVERAKAAGVEA